MSRLATRLQAIDRQEDLRQRNAEIRALAAEYGLTPAEVQREFKAIERQIRAYGPMTLDDQIAMLAAEYNLDPEDLRSEAERVALRRPSGGVQ